MKTLFPSRLAAVALVALTATFGLQAATPTADELMAAAGVKATGSNKTIYVRFSASWCGWCKRHDAFLARPDVKPVFEKYFVPVKLIVQESEAHKSDENPGADQWLVKMGGPEGLPYSAFVDAKGALIVNSKRPTGKGTEARNIGHPFAPEEVDWFVAMMKKAAPSMTADDLKTLETALRSQKK